MQPSSRFYVASGRRSPHRHGHGYQRLRLQRADVHGAGAPTAGAGGCDQRQPDQANDAGKEATVAVSATATD
jgi:hypothetical protein